ncbi:MULTISPECIES: hypothetical protein [unclassified Streptomyces]|jgi:hypothetical protein|uniref:hypothetical protein n=1 Tax=unclassified Streptomyces TaxID=2593676 RepID=UPI0013A6A77A|nr:MULTISPECIES: hypothetical protein [unclassified Streptomyces]QZZ31986.1 hypothetical protein A7X85_42435 [Streptomyces sp. ST1015]
MRRLPPATGELLDFADELERLRRIDPELVRPAPAHPLAGGRPGQGPRRLQVIPPFFAVASTTEKRGCELDSTTVKGHAALSRPQAAQVKLGR